jgi:hypothetical protein
MLSQLGSQGPFNQRFFLLFEKIARKAGTSFTKKSKIAEGSEGDAPFTGRAVRCLRLSPALRLALPFVWANVEQQKSAWGPTSADTRCSAHFCHRSAVFRALGALPPKSISTAALGKTNQYLGPGRCPNGDWVACRECQLDRLIEFPLTRVPIALPALRGHDWLTGSTSRSILVTMLKSFSCAIFFVCSDTPPAKADVGGTRLRFGEFANRQLNASGSPKFLNPS